MRLKVRFQNRLKHWRTEGWYDDRYDLTLKEGRVYFDELIGSQIAVLRFIDLHDPMAIEPWVAFAYADGDKLRVEGCYASFLTRWLKGRS